MKLYMVPLAPNPTRVMLYIAEREALGVDLGVEQVVVNPNKGEQRAPEHLARNPFGTLPVLEFEPGRYLIESRVIVDYLEDAVPGPSLFPTDVAERALVRDLERVIELRMALPIMRLVHAENSPLGYAPKPALASDLREEMSQPLQYLNNLLADERPFLAGSAVSLADCTLAAALQFARFAKIDVLPGLDRVAHWDARYREGAPASRVLRW
jgi:glutathione S-transferase